MLRCLALACATFAFATPAVAACSGQDLRPGLSDAQRQELAQTIESTPYAKGNFWTATKGDETVYLVGTLHINDPRMQGPVARLTPIVESAGVLLLEANDVAEAELEKQIATDTSLILLQGKSLIDLMSEKEWQKLAQRAKDHNIPPFMAAKMQPWFLSMTLAIPPCMQQEVMEGTGGLDAQLNDIANAAGVPTQSLEDVQTLFKIFSKDPIQEQIDMMMVGLMAPNDAEDAMATMFNSYFEESVAEGWHINRILTPELAGMNAELADEVFADLNKDLLETRNTAWIPVILDAAAQHDAPIVAAFGAAHLMGDAGVLNLLAQEGFTLERQEF
ncbi:TraB/GumN family protein [uncultured Pelagimonas sp.]|uniref:TraB/GumN family protein n=1 Tax=uncultured Pelagimonas sp. TaxID=1618102 RepID=UPI00260D0EFA|nr:TraB/GumN family protein [uncultured Pelagimonas sp.]